MYFLCFLFWKKGRGSLGSGLTFYYSEGCDFDFRVTKGIEGTLCLNCLIEIGLRSLYPKRYVV